jgi:hypothetical protein
MAEITFLQSPVLTKFVYPFLLIFFIIFAILEKSKILGENKQINALVSFVIGFIFVSAVFPKEMGTNLILFLTIAIIVVFVVLVLWGFIMGEEGLKFASMSKGLRWAIGILIVVAVTIAVLWAAGVSIGNLLDDILNISWGSAFWTNFIFIVVVAIALAVILRTGKK